MMVLYAHTTKVGLMLAFTLALAACGKPDRQSGASTLGAASAPAFPTGNRDKVMTLADCDKLPDPKPADDSAAGRAAAVGQGHAARAACKKEVVAQQDKANGDLARIRELQEKEAADRANRKHSEQEWGKRLNEAANTPIKEYKY